MPKPLQDKNYNPQQKCRHLFPTTLPQCWDELQNADRQSPTVTNIGWRGDFEKRPTTFVADCSISVANASKTILKQSVSKPLDRSEGHADQF